MELLSSFLSRCLQVYGLLLSEVIFPKNHKQDLFIGINIEKVTKEKHGENLDNFEELKKIIRKNNVIINLLFILMI